jgi:hypothetical protein
MIAKILMPLRYIFFSGTSHAKNFGVKRVWPEAILG